MRSPGAVARSQAATALVVAAVLDDHDAAGLLLAEDDQARIVAWELARWYARVVQREHEQRGEGLMRPKGAKLPRARRPPPGAKDGTPDHDSNVVELCADRQPVKSGVAATAAAGCAAGTVVVGVAATWQSLVTVTLTGSEVSTRTGCFGSMDVSVHPGGGDSVTVQLAGWVSNTSWAPPFSPNVRVVVNGGVWPPSVEALTPSVRTGSQSTPTVKVVPGAALPVTTLVTASVQSGGGVGVAAVGDAPHPTVATPAF